MTARDGLIDGQEPESINEYYVALALDRLELDYHYQYQVFGGKRVRGGQVIDFLVFKAPKPIPVFVGAEGYWHSGSRGAEDKLKQAELVAEYPEWDMPVELTEEETNTQEEAFVAVKEKIGT